MNRIDACIQQMQQQQRCLLSPYITAGDPILGSTVAVMHGLVAGGANILEIGIPFSDPMAEGPVIQAAMERSLAQGTTLQDVFQTIEQFRQQNNTTPIILMGYLNPIEFYGYERFAKEAHRVGVDGTILVDLPPEESATVKEIWQKNNLYPIYLCSPTTTAQRMQRIDAHAKGYLYYVSIKGVTGSNALDIKSLQQQYLQRKEATKHPLLVGFGIKDPQMAAAVSQFADGVIVGAALIECLKKCYEEHGDAVASAQQFMRAMRDAMDNKSER
mgnify:CR=1 FL=1